MKILLTGGAGYIGSHVALSLIDNKHDVHIIDDLSTGNKKLIPNGCRFSNCNIKNNDVIGDILKKNKFDILLHFAGFIKVEESVNEPKKYFQNNTDYAIQFFNNCKKHNLNKIIFSSTASVYGDISEDKLISEDEKLNPQNPYAESKAKTENFLINNSKDFNFIILRYFNVAGADKELRSGQISEKSSHLIKILSEVSVGKRNFVEVYGSNYNTKDGTAIRDYIHVSDLADIHLKVSELLFNKSESKIFNCGYGKGYSVLEVIEAANKISNGKIKFKFSGRRNGDVTKLVSDISEIKKYIDWTPKYNSLETILNSSIRWERKINDEYL